MSALEPAYPLETERLLLRPFVGGDFDALFAMHSRADVARWTYWEPRSEEEVRKTLVGDGVIKNDEEEFDSLFLIRKGDRLVWTDPQTGKESKVTAAAGESDGLVVVKQNGALLPCAVDQVRRVKRAAPASRK